MNSRPETCSAAAFEQRYRRSLDPWRFATSDYERQRYRIIIEALERPFYARAFEPGCSVGELSAKLATRCGQLIATDISSTAVQRARRRCAALDNVDFRCADIAEEIPPGQFDLIVFSEIGYYFAASDLAKIACTLGQALRTGGDFVAVHWLGNSEDHLLHGDAVHTQLLAALPLSWQRGERHSGFRIDSWRRT